MFTEWFLKRSPFWSVSPGNSFKGKFPGPTLDRLNQERQDWGQQCVFYQVLQAIRGHTEVLEPPH